MGESNSAIAKQFPKYQSRPTSAYSIFISSSYHVFAPSPSSLSYPQDGMQAEVQAENGGEIKGNDTRSVKRCEFRQIGRS